MRGLGDPDAFPATDLGVLLAAKQVGLPEDPAPSPSTALAGGRGDRMPPNTSGPRSTTR